MRLKQRELKEWREKRLQANGGNCELCGLRVRREVADHDHRTGLLRGCICAGCNSLLGRLENNAPRYGVNLTAFCAGLVRYLGSDQAASTGGVFHPSYRTPDEKKLLVKKRRKRARLSREVT